MGGGSNALWHHKFEDPTPKIREALRVSEPPKGKRVPYILVFCELKPPLMLC